MLKVNVGVSRKIGEAGYGSRGGSVHLEAELDGSLAATPARLQDRIRHLFGLARDALVAELQSPVAAPPVVKSVPAAATLPTQATAINVVSTTPSRNGVKKATPAQVKAIYGLARNKAVSARDFCDHRCGVARPENLTLRQASQLIDELRAMPDPIVADEEETELIRC